MIAVLATMQSAATAADSPAVSAPTTAPTTTPTTAPTSPWPRLSDLLGLKGHERDSVYTVTIPRDDLNVMTLDAGAIPAAAGLETTFHFFMCDCGKTNVIGTFILADYEANDVIDELRKARIHIVSVGPVLYNERPRLLAVRFQGEGTAEEIASAIKAALQCTGDARNQEIKNWKEPDASK